MCTKRSSLHSRFDMSGRGPQKASSSRVQAEPKASAKQALALNPVVANVRRQTVKLHELEEEFAAMDDEEKIRGVSEIVAEEKAKKQMRLKLDAARQARARLGARQTAGRDGSLFLFLTHTVFPVHGLVRRSGVSVCIRRKQRADRDRLWTGLRKRAPRGT